MLIGRLLVSAAALPIAVLLLRAPGDPGPPMALLAASLVGLGALVVHEWRRPSITVRTVAVASGLLLVLAVARPPLHSNDVWSYAMYGRIVSHHHASPYTHVPSTYRADPWYHRMDEAWRDTPSVYGPLFTGVSAAVMWAARDSAVAARVGFQGLAALAVAMALYLIARRTRDPVAMAFVGLNPFVIVAVVNGGHNDALVGLGVLAGVVLGTRGRPGLAGLVLGLAALVKIPALLPLAALAVWLGRGQLKKAVVLALAGGLVVLAGYGVAGGARALHPVEEARVNVSGASPWNKPRLWMTTERVEDGEKGKVAGEIVRRQVSLWAGLAVLTAAVTLTLRRRLTPTAPLAAGAAVLAFTLLGSYVLPWYLAWGLFALALTWRSPLAWLAMGQALLLQLAYVPDGRIYGHGDAFLNGDTAERIQKTLRVTAIPTLELAAVALLIIAAIWPRRAFASTSDACNTAP